MMRISGYEVRGEIGSGGMGTVYQAVQVSLDRTVAVKVVHKHLAKDPSIRARFFNEAKLTAALSHPHIVQVYDFLESDEELLIVMEFIEGRCLSRMIGQEVGPIPWEKALPLFAQVLSGVGYAHARGVVHRDIKPANILVSAAGGVKITDFGIAKIAGQKGMTRTGAQMGTLYYESPEQIRGARDVDHRADIYALGMTLYEMLAGRLPFDDAGDTSEYAIMDSIVKREAHLDPREYYPHVPEWLVGVVQKATELEPEVRYQSCEEFLRAMEQGGKLGTGEHSYWSGKVASVATMKPITASASPSTPAPSSPENSCPKCGSLVKDEMEFCGKCGADLQKECPGCTKRIRWHHEHCPKCGVNIEKKKAEIKAEAERIRAALAAEAERKRIEEERLTKEWEEYNQKKAEEKRRKAEERASRLNARRERIESFRLSWSQWWMRNGWKVAVGLVVLGLVTGYVAYRNSELYVFHRAERFYRSGDLTAAAEAFMSLGDYRDSRDQSLAIRYEIAEGLYESGDQTGAAEAFMSLGDYRDSRDQSLAIRYEIAEGLYESGDLSGAASVFEDIEGYRDSRDRARVIRWHLLGFTKEGEVITDHNTGLQWRVGPDRNTDWNAARTWVNGLGGSWRMPTRAELRGLWDAGISTDNWGPFENSGWRVWSGEVRDSSSAWDFDFFSGYEYWDGRSNSYGGRAFAVRPRG